MVPRWGRLTVGQSTIPTRSESPPHTFLHPDLRVGRSSWWTRERTEVRGDFQPTLAGIAGREEAAGGRKCDGGAAVSAVGSVHGKTIVTLEELGRPRWVLPSVQWSRGRISKFGPRIKMMPSPRE